MRFFMVFLTMFYSVELSAAADQGYLHTVSKQYPFSHNPYPNLDNPSQRQSRRRPQYVQGVPQSMPAFILSASEGHIEDSFHRIEHNPERRQNPRTPLLTPQRIQKRESAGTTPPHSADLTPQTAPHPAGNNVSILQEQHDLEGIHHYQHRAYQQLLREGKYYSFIENNILLHTKVCEGLRFFQNVKMVVFFEDERLCHQSANIALIINTLASSLLGTDCHVLVSMSKVCDGRKRYISFSCKDDCHVFMKKLSALMAESNPHSRNPNFYDVFHNKKGFYLFNQSAAACGLSRMRIVVKTDEEQEAIQSRPENGLRNNTAPQIGTTEIATPYPHNLQPSVAAGADRPQVWHQIQHHYVYVVHLTVGQQMSIVS